MSIMRKEIFEQPEVLRKCIETNGITVTALVAALKKHDVKFISIAARGTSDHAAIFGKYVFEYLVGCPTCLAAPSIASVYGRKLDLRGTLVIGISQSGMAQDVLEYLEEGKGAGAITASITNNIDSPLAKAAEFHLFCNAGLEKSVAATKTFVTEMMLLLMTGLIWSGNTDYLKLCGTVPDLLEQSLESLEGSAKQAAEHLKNIRDCITLSRGFSYPIALESALKIQETCYVKAKGYSVSDFYHGPIAIADESLQTILIAPESKMMHDFEQVAKRLREAHAGLTIISPSESLRSYADFFFPVPKTDEITAPFVNAAAIQLLACKLADEKGINPDMPRMLKKVTITV